MLRSLPPAEAVEAAHGLAERPHVLNEWTALVWPDEGFARAFPAPAVSQKAKAAATWQDGIQAYVKRRMAEGVASSVALEEYLTRIRQKGAPRG